MISENDEKTILLAEHEAQNIQDSVRHWLARRKEVAGTRRRSRSPAAAIREATGISLMLDMGGSVDPDLVGKSSGQPSRPLIVLDQPYQPSVMDIKDLQPTKLADLCMETHHRGFVLKVKRVSPVISLTVKSWAIVQDMYGEAERLELHLQTQSGRGEVLESASEFYIKEPYLTINRHGEVALQIDHPSDLVPCSTAEGDDVHKAISSDSSTSTEKHVLTLKEAGNAALKQRDYTSAYTLYTKALEMGDDLQCSVSSSLIGAILRNRAHVALLTGRYEQAKADSLASVSKSINVDSESLIGKAYFRAGCATYRLGQFHDALGFFSEQRRITPDDKDAHLYLRRIAMRTREQETGEYNLPKLRNGHRNVGDYVDAANYTKMTVVQESAGRGRGLFAVRDLPAGSLVLCEKAFCVAQERNGQLNTALVYNTRDHQLRVSSVGLVRKLATKLALNPGCIGKVLCLERGHLVKANDTSLDSTHGKPVTDIFQLHDIVQDNAFALAGSSSHTGVASTGLWLHAALINHSCLPNVEPGFIGDLMMLRATRRIQEGEEIFHSYDATRDYDARQVGLRTTWNFECDCELCQAEREDAEDVRKRRTELMRKADVFIHKTSMPAKRLAILEAKRLFNAINATYDKERYRDLPRTAAQAIENWLKQVR
jgi:tetratricopeptide (TPR) repeat protein